MIADASKKRGFLVLNQHWLTAELRQRGHEVTTACFNNTLFDLNIEQLTITIDDLLAYVPHPVDTIIFHDDSGLPRLLGLESCQATKVFYSVDAHHHHEWHAHFASMFDLVLVAQRNYIDSFVYSPNRHWFPVWSLYETPFNPQRSGGVVFRGNIESKLNPKRRIFFDELAKIIPVDAGTGDVFEAYTKAKIVINQAVSDDLNFRVFEAMASGALLITPSGTVGLESLFTDGQELVIYERDNVRDAADKIRYYLEHEAERERIASAGWRLVHSKHTNKARADTLLDLLEGTRRPTEPIRDIRYDLVARVEVFSYLAHRAAEAEASEQLVSAASNSLIRAFQSECVTSDEELSGLVFILTDLLRELRNDNLCLDLLRVARISRPGQLTLALLYLEQLLLVGKEAEAKMLAAELSDRPDELILSAPRLLADVRRERSTWSKKPVQT